MELKKIHFDAYKSLVDEVLVLTHDCTGFVGINESGKSNILNATKTLSSTHSLQPSDSPKMSNRLDPLVRFEFSLNKSERDLLIHLISSFSHGTIPSEAIEVNDKTTVFYHVTYSLEEREERRYFSINGIPIPKDCQVLNPLATTANYMIMLNDLCLPLENAYILPTSQIIHNKELADTSESLNEIRLRIASTEECIEKLSLELTSVSNVQPSTIPDDQDVETQPEEEDDIDGTNEHVEQVKRDSIELTTNDIELQKTVLDELKNNYEKMKSRLEGFDLHILLSEAQEQIDASESALSKYNDKITTLEKEITELEELSSRDEEQEKELTKYRRSLTITQKQLFNENHILKHANTTHESLSESITDKYTTDKDVWHTQLSALLHTALTEMLPSVVFWEHTRDYILAGETEFEDIYNAESLNDISRPLVNIFRM